ncbi:hypothetical protein FGB62_181g00 [Gracilaria domingensis]|nr:hypothetical protein FGB62_181g00 [Gracilaria domingensis]
MQLPANGDGERIAHRASKRARIHPFGPATDSTIIGRRVNEKMLLGGQRQKIAPAQTTSPSYLQHAGSTRVRSSGFSTGEIDIFSNAPSEPRIHVPSISFTPQMQGIVSRGSQSPVPNVPASGITDDQLVSTAELHSSQRREASQPNLYSDMATEIQAQRQRQLSTTEENTERRSIPAGHFGTRPHLQMQSPSILRATRAPLLNAISSSTQNRVSKSLGRTAAFREQNEVTEPELLSSSRPPRQPSVPRYNANRPGYGAGRQAHVSPGSPSASAGQMMQQRNHLRSDHEGSQPTVAQNARTTSRIGARGRNMPSRRRGAPESRGGGANRTSNATTDQRNTVPGSDLQEMKEQLRICNKYLEKICGNTEKTARFAESVHQVAPQLIHAVGKLENEVSNLRTALVSRRNRLVSVEDGDSHKKRHILLANSLADVMRFLYAAKRCDKFQMRPEITFNEKSSKATVLEIVSSMISMDLENSNLRGVPFETFLNYSTVSNNVGVKDIGSAGLIIGDDVKVQAIAARALQFLRYRNKVLSETGKDLLRDGTTFHIAYTAARRTVKLRALKHLKRSAREMAKGLTDVELQYILRLVMDMDKRRTGTAREIHEVDLNGPIFGENDAWIASKYSNSLQIEWIWLKLALSLRLTDASGRVLSRDERSALIGVRFKTGNGYSHIVPYLQECLEVARCIRAEENTSSEPLSVYKGRTDFIQKCECTKDVDALEKLAAATTPLDAISARFDDSARVLTIATSGGTLPDNIDLEERFPCFSDLSFRSAMTSPRINLESTAMGDQGFQQGEDPSFFPNNSERNFLDVGSRNGLGAEDDHTGNDWVETANDAMDGSTGLSWGCNDHFEASGRLRCVRDAANCDSFAGEELVHA